MRLVFNVSFTSGFSFTDLFSITFIWIVPVIIGIVPMLVATTEQLSFLRYRFVWPLLTVLLFFMVCFAIQLEDVICIMIISIPFLLGAAVGGILFGAAIKSYRKRKGVLYSVLIIPLFAGLTEQQFSTPSGIFTVETSVVVNSSPEKIWKNIVRVRLIRDDEYTKGFFHYAGIPSPLYAELDADTLGGNRMGHFEGGLVFNERVTHWARNKKVAFDISVVPSSVRETVFDQHILKGQHFRFLNASYELKVLDEGRTLLVLTSAYRLDTTVNWYASFWGDKLLTDFQKRLLNVIKRRCES